MAEIKVLENNLINKIAAGEVVERPLNVIKELVENSVDAKATQITVEVKNGGLTSMSVSDNGSGIDREFVKTAFLRHATSKISTVDDLSNILTLGFRGEALSSISSVSEVILTTKTVDDDLGIELTIINGEIVSEKNVNAHVGTTFVVNNLFFNVPARLKFLKKPAVEGAYISDIMQTFMLANPEIKFNYVVNGTKTLSTMGKGFEQVIYDVFGKNISKSVIYFDNEDSQVKIYGAIGKPDVSRGTKKAINFFINGRYIKSELLNSALKDGYGTRLMIGRFPLCVINLEIDPVYVDVNVHPTKLEVRFSNENLVYDKLCEVVRKTLSLDDNNLPSLKLVEKKNFVKPKFEVEEKDVKEIRFAEATNTHTKESEFIIEIEEDTEDMILREDVPKEKVKPLISSIIYDKVGLDSGGDGYVGEKEKFTDIVEKKPIKKEKKVVVKHDYNIIGQLFNTYWILQKNDSMYFLDQHAGHERLIYERYKRELEDEKVVSQILLTPLTIVLTFEESLFVKENIDKFQKFGFGIEEFGENIFAIRSMPMIFDSVTDIGFFHDILRDFNSNDNLYDFKDDTVILKSCKAAIKANRALDFIEAKNLIEDILNERLTHCPHGRPIFVELSKKEIEKMFKRIV
ncbi:MAG: DNA mismatch repair endonuclease MutL [Lachnospirales bacterium]